MFNDKLETRLFNHLYMGTGKRYALHEIDDTKAAGRDQQFEEILDRVEEAGGEITKDETFPLYIDIGMDEIEYGHGREVEFTMGGFNFQMKRKVETSRIVGDGRNKSLEPLSPPRVNVSMKRKKEYEDNWVIVDLEEGF